MLHRHARPAVAGAYLAGAVTGALITASALFVLSGLLTPIPAAVRNVIALSSIGVLLVHAVGGVRLALPQRKYQIPRETFGVWPERAAFRFAFELGTGVRTYITSASPYALALLLALLLPADLGSAAAVVVAAAVGYGLGRSIVVASQIARRAVAVDHPPRWLRAADVVSLVMALIVVLVR